MFSQHLLRASPSITAVQPQSDTADGNCVLVGDIGGTNARLYVWKIEDDGEFTLVFQKWYKTADYKNAGFVAVLDALANEEAVKACPPVSACFAIAGPVENGIGQMTNLGWTIDAPLIEEQFGWRVAVINDFEALGYGIPELEEKDLLVLNDVPAEDKAPMAVLGPGTGLGQAQLMYDESKGSYKVWPSEGSHSDFAPRGDKQIALMKWITEGLGYCEVEHVACGAGLERIYTFLSAGDKVSAIEPAVKKAADVSKEALSGENDVASDALDMMLSILGAEAGSMSLRNLARGGVYLAGGITPKVIERVKSGIVAENFLHTPDHRFHSFFKGIRFSAVLNEEVGLIGARKYASQLLVSN